MKFVHETLTHLGQLQSNPGIGIAGVATLGYFGFLIGPPLIGTIAEFLGLDRALLLIVVFCTLIGIFAGRVNLKSISSQETSKSTHKP